MGRVLDGTYKEKELLVTLAVLLAVVLIVTGVIITQRKASEETDTISSAPTTTEQISTVQNTSPEPVTQEVTQTEVVAETPESSQYKDGTYSSTGSYSTPEGAESIIVNITLADDIVTSTSATTSANDRDSKEYTQAFLENFKALVVGKTIDDIKLSRVSGSSLTSQGFNSALTKIKAQAKS